jgi:phosphoribosylamine---glycine ligase
VDVSESGSTRDRFDCPEAADRHARARRALSRLQNARAAEAGTLCERAESGAPAQRAKRDNPPVKVLVVGSGGREHALAWAISRSSALTELHAAPGNPGISSLASCHPVRAEDPASLVPLARDLPVDLVVVGPEAPLVAGLADALRQRGIAVFGPGAEAARIEGSKAFAKDVLEAAEVPTARTLPVARPPCVVKADGLAAGKGVWVCHTQAELDTALRAAEALGQPFHVEELLEGEEVSVFALCDGTRAVALPAAQDYKRIGDGDEGPNTGGMGSFSPVSRFSDADVEELVETIHRPVLAELARRRAPFVGALYAGLMLTADGPRVLEFNCRFGDPETQSLLPGLEGDLLETLAAAAHGDLQGTSLTASTRAAVTVVLAARDYPERGDTGTPIEGIADAEAAGALVFHAGTALHDGRLVTNGGRILGVTGLGETLGDARTRVYAAVDRIQFDGMRYRSDIAAGA